MEIHEIKTEANNGDITECLHNEKPGIGLLVSSDVIFPAVIELWTSSSACHEMWFCLSRYRFASSELNVRPVYLWILSIKVFTTAGHLDTQAHTQDAICNTFCTVLCTIRGDHRSRGDRSFATAGPWLWNSLPADVRSASSLTTFRQKLKTHSFGILTQTLCHNYVAIVVLEVTLT